jgi:tRNA(Ile2) C34 agmatinyltransferase TiaS
VILAGIDDTDTLDSPGTNQLARRLAEVLPPGFECTLVLRHQLFFDRRIPYTSKNGSASLGIRSAPGRRLDELLPVLRAEMRAWYVPGSDPGLGLAGEDVAPEISAFARRCQREVVRQDEARALAARHGVYLEGFGGTEDGVIGALAAIGLLATGDDGRVVHLAGWRWPDDFAGHQPVSAVRARGVDEIRAGEDGPAIEHGTVDIGKHLRPSYRGGRVVLFVEPEPRGAAGGGNAGACRWSARKLP